MSDVDETKNLADLPDGNDPSGLPASEQLELKLPDESGELKDLGLWAGVLVLLALVAYWPAAGGRFLWRDGHAVNDNMWVRYPDALAPAWLARWEKPAGYPFTTYQPVTATAYWLEYRLEGHADPAATASSNSALPPPPTPLAFHLANLMFHAGAAVLLWLVLRELAVPGAWIISALFALHPLNTEPVSWIADQSWVLGGLLFFGSAYLYLMFVKHRERDAVDRAAGGQGIDPALTWGLYSGSAIIFLLAALANPATSPLPVVILLVLWWRRRLVSQDNLLLLPLLVVAAGLWLANGDLRAQGGQSLWHRGWEAQLAAIGSGFFCFLRVLAPISLQVFHKQWAPGQWLLGAFAVACWMGVTAFFWTRRVQLGRGLFTGSAIYGLLQICSLNWFDPARLADFSDATSYLAGVPIIAVMTVLVIKLLKQAQIPATFAQAAVAISATLLIVFGGVTWSRAHVFDNPVAFWQDAAAKNPQSSRILSALAEELRLRAVEEAGQGDSDSSSKDLEESLRQAQDSVAADSQNAMPHRTWANVLVAEGDVTKALPQFQKAVDLQPDDFQTLLEYGSALNVIGRFKQAVVPLDAALRVDADSPVAHRLLGEAFAGLGNTTRAIAEEQQALVGDPNDAAARQTLAEQQAKAGQLRDALTNYAMSMAVDKTRMNKPELWIAIAKLKERQHDWDQAIQWYQGALKLDADNVEAKKAIEVDTPKAKAAAATRLTTRAASQPGASELTR